MTTTKLTFGDFEIEQLSKNEQKTVRGGDDRSEPVDPLRGNGKGSL
ncbi:rSAM-modified peptide [Flavobacterium sp. AC]|uniref:RSAM-modified peptide n=1 Tax=Flavobacterium azizsancarii TaxID=2961580 RepID=A0ABT4WII0_9FLAO|nr:rSAM-modified peptide [Flavobacterium azizsancarii]MDA6072403.1 rSAM-modified peptide [Flavobacterium azizsancarii]MDA6072404.1 rSAM-modified peptide [Flavobacterium azizsancarii]